MARRVNGTSIDVEPPNCEAKNLDKFNHMDCEATFTMTIVSEGNGNPLQCSCLENPRDRGAWWAAIYGVAQS